MEWIIILVIILAVIIWYVTSGEIEDIEEIEETKINNEVGGDEDPKSKEGQDSKIRDEK